MKDKYCKRGHLMITNRDECTQCCDEYFLSHDVLGPLAAERDSQIDREQVRNKMITDAISLILAALRIGIIFAAGFAFVKYLERL